jgi:magnesium-transporting ATPase (P-type)
MGQITDIVTGLTGTMTSGDMNVVKFYTQKKVILNTRKDTFKHCEVSKQLMKIIEESVLWNAECHLELN